jgi:hypothetical protein
LFRAVKDAILLDELRPPAEAELRRHVKRYGPECVAELADAYGMTALAVELAESNGTRKRHTSDTMREQVRALHARGVVPAAIADTLNISDDRVRKLLRTERSQTHEALVS